MSKWILKKRYGGGLLAAMIGLFIVTFAVLMYTPGQQTARADGDDGIANRAYWQHKWESFSGTADQAIKVGDVLALHKTTGRVMKADADAGASTFAIGLAGNNAAIGQSVEVVKRGVLAGLFVPTGGNTGLTPFGAPLLLSASAGGITTFSKYGGGVTVQLGHVLPMTEYATASGVTVGSDRVFVDVPTPSGTSPYSVQ